MLFPDCSVNHMLINTVSLLVNTLPQLFHVLYLVLVNAVLQSQHPAIICRQRLIKEDYCGLTRSSAIAEGPRDASCQLNQLKSCQLPRNSVETTYTTSPDQIDDMKLEI